MLTALGTRHGTTDGYADNVHGIPGFETVGLAPSLAFSRLTGGDALAIAAEVFGLAASKAVRLETERDDTFRLTVESGDLVLKVAHPADAVDDIDLQIRALLHATRADASLPLQNMVPSASGELAPVLAAHDNRIARLFTWLSGTELLDVRPDDPQLVKLGDALGRLSLSLRDFEHPAAIRVWAWDLLSAPRLRTLLDLVPNRLAKRALDGFDERVVPLLAELPRQVVHNDFNPGNVLVDDQTRDYVSGILDFGDTVLSLRVADLAVALCYQLYPLGRRWETVTPMIEGFERYVPLTAAEREVLPELVAVRFAQRLLINDWLSKADSGRAREPYFRRGLLGAFETLLKET